MLLTDLQSEYLLTLEILGRAEGTIYNHKYATRLFIEFMENSYQIYQLELVKPVHLKQLILYWKNEKEWAHRTVNKMFGLIKVMFNYAVEEEYISEQDNPVRKIKKLKLRILVDTNSIELFINDGQQVMTKRVYPLGEDNLFKIISEQALYLSQLNYWKMKTIWKGK